ncbi:MAG: HAD family hydrolase [Firmicutes bacterium HGW-Firmicutes-7]|nr:MAG: HAD family hydrolase [Firmicutes bacterium HGW-Firmicutes-7]
MFKNIDAVLFDLDGTLVDSMWLWKSVDIEYLKKFDIEFPDDFQDDIEGMSFTETAQYFKEHFNLPVDIDSIKEEWNIMAGEYYKHKVQLKEKVPELLSYLIENDYKTGIGTSNSKELVNMIVDKFNLRGHFGSIRTSCEVNKGKPHPDIYLKVAEDLGVRPENCLVFEDVPAGIMAAKNAGMKVCAIYDDFSKKIIDEIKELADYYIESFNDIIEIVEDDNDETVFAN